MKPKAIILEIDGVLADNSHRLHHITGEYFRDEKTKEYPTLKPFVKPDWDSFYAAIGRDKINKWCEELIWRFWETIDGQNDGLHRTKIIILTGRPQKYRKQTKEWVFDCNIGEYMLFMRPDFLPSPSSMVTICHHCDPKRDKSAPTMDVGTNCLCMVKDDRKPDNRPAWEVKKEIYEKDIRDKYDILFVIEDDCECVTMYRGLGLVCLDVGKK